MSAAAWVFLVALTVVSVFLAIAVGGNSNLAAENRRVRTENARLRRHPGLRAVGTPTDHDGLYSSTCSCGHQVRVHGDLGCDGDPGCTCSRDSLTAALDAGLVGPVEVPTGGAE